MRFLLYIYLVCIFTFVGSAWSLERDMQPVLSNDSISDAEDSRSTALPTVAPVSNSAYVLLVPRGEVSSSYSNYKDSSYLVQLRNAINATQLYYKKEDEFLPISTDQTNARVQNYMALSVHRQLDECGVVNKVQDDAEITDANSATKVLPVSNDLKQDFIYRIDLGVNRLAINRSVLSNQLSGEAEALIFENTRQTKKILVNSYTFGDTELKFENQNAAPLERDAELKNITSRVVDRLAERLSKQICQYFN